MKLRTNMSASRQLGGVTLIECLVYVAVFAILLGIGTASFLMCWDHTQATMFTANEIESTLRAGECWRTDVRAATGTISIQTTETEEIVKIPAGGKEIIYHLAGGELQRETSPQTSTRLLLAKVKTSAMRSEIRNGVNAWRWDIELAPNRKDAHIPLLFTFEAAQAKP